MTAMQTLKAQSLVLGFSATLWQILLLRAFMTIFYGNELIIGLLLCAWLLFVALGCWAHDRLSCTNLSSSLIVVVFVCTILLVFISVKFSRILLHAPMGELISLPQIALFAIPCIGLSCFILGYWYGHLVKVMAQHNISNPAAKVYIYECCGATMAGLIFTFVLASRLSDFFILILLAAATLSGTALVQKRRSLLALACALLGLGFGYGKQIDFNLSAHYWQSVAAGMKLQSAWTSRYGEWAILDWGGEKNLYCNGLKQATLPDPIDSQLLAALLLTQHANARQVVLIGGGWGGLVQELAKKDSLDLTYVEMDEAAFHHVEKYQSSAQGSRVVFQDGRRFLQQSKNKFDLIIINAGRPTTALINRFYTKEFFLLAAQRLAPDGVLALAAIPSGENVLGAGLLQLNSAIWWDLRQAFKETLVIPGDQACYLACNDRSRLCTNPDTLSMRYGRLHRQDRYFHPAMFKNIMQPERRVRFVHVLESQVASNTDMRPVSYYTDLLIWLKQFSGIHMTNGLPRDWLWPSLYLTGLLTWAIWHFTRKAGRPILLIMFFGGFISLATNIIFLLMMQSIYGYVYEGMGAALSLYMAGMALSAWWQDHRKPNPRFWLPILMFATMLFLFLLMPLLRTLMRHTDLIYFFGLIAVAGLLAGAPFPLATALDSVSGGTARRSRIYAVDLFGAALGSFYINTFSIPIFGFSSTLLGLAGLSALAGLLAAIRRKA